MKKVIDGTLVKFTFDGYAVTDADTKAVTFNEALAPVTFDATKASAINRAYAEMHGWQARIGDNAAISRKQKDGSIITITEQMRRDAVLELVTHIESGTDAWEMKGSRAAPQNPTWLKLAEKRGVSYDTIAAEKAAADLAELEAM